MPSKQPTPQSPTHTPTPWVFNGESIIDAKGNSAMTKANAAFIVRAVNAHEELLVAIKTLTAITYDTVNYDQNDADTVKAVEMAENAIARAEGGK